MTDIEANAEILILMFLKSLIAKAEVSPDKQQHLFNQVLIFKNKLV